MNSNQISSPNIEGLLQQILQGQARIEQRLNVIENRLDSVEKRLDLIEERLDLIEKRLDAVEERLIKVEKRLDKLEIQFKKMQKDQLFLRENMNYLIEWIEKTEKQLSSRIYSIETHLGITGVAEKPIEKKYKIV